ncbi:MAG TPA: protein-L-isoaspartate(D-aspartate) O-methyltransferase [Burkholderiaceae bacterium]|jgi:protein-L-isoaspartate(D-aspartate) O-methyltransferase|nr:protein-L-isoaspartate(D-aspartate) O-methyltransferase [Burkholderiaceae bacterium]
MDRSFQSERDDMVERQLVGRGIRDDRVLRAMRTVPRERFVDERMAPFAYDDSPLPIEAGQTISQPFMVAWMVEAAEVGPDDRVLEIGTGSGYASAVLARVADTVHTIERHELLARGARARLDALGCRNIHLRTGDGTLGWPEAAPFDAILVAAAGPEVPAPLKEQLRVGGRLLMPLDVGDHGTQRLLKVVRHGESDYGRQTLGSVAFVPLIGQYGWSESDAQAGAHTSRP